VVVDLDGFKQINDQQGHQIGDQMLQTAAAQLAAQLRSTDLLARVGGDEFALLVFSPTPDGLEDLVERLRGALAKAGVQASIGATLSEERATLDQTWAKADEAMYRDKSACAGRSANLGSSTDRDAVSQPTTPAASESA
jgi:diguanylate cyclase (GGDEF)-like protein